MTREEKLEGFLNAFLEGNADGKMADPDFFRNPGWEETAGMNAGTDYAQGETWDALWTAEGPGAWEDRDTAVPRGKGKLPLRTKVSIFLILVLIPLTIWVGIRFFNDRKYLVISLAIAVCSVAPFFLVFEGRKPQARELLVISVLAAIAVAGRAAFFMTANFKPVAAVVIVSAVCFGAEAGFMVGAVSMLASNMLVGQGPWTPWQMFAMGIIGFLAGVFFQKGWLEARRGALCAFGFLAVLFVYGGIMNPASLVMMSTDITWKGLLAVYMSGIPMDLVHAASTVIFLWLASRPMIEKLERIKTKYGILEG